MAKFTVIDGGGRGRDDSRAQQLAKHHFRRLVVETLRAVARGEDNNARVLTQLNKFIQSASETDANIGQLIGDVTSEMHAKIRRPEGAPRHHDIDSIVLEGLKLSAEQCTDDGFTNARVSTQQTRIDGLIEMYIVNREGRSRENGWSWLGDLIKTNFKRKPIRTLAKPKSGSQK